MLDERILKREERAIVSLRTLYKSYGYLPYKMSKFEEYDMYATNKDFLVSDRIITFAGTDGRLLALKPDVTLSIIKNTRYEDGIKQKLYYNENVYRPSGSTGQYKEIMQTGIENIGDLDVCDLAEAIYLAAESLRLISEDFVLDISHMGVLCEVFDRVGCNETVRRRLTECIAAKSAHLIDSVCRECGIDGKYTELLTGLVALDGSFCEAVGALSEALGEGCEALTELSTLASLISDSDIKDKVRLDFSVVNNMNYYNGIVFSGFVPGICERVLAGGEYGGLLSGMGLSGRAIGFAVYLDLLSELDFETSEYDVDVLLLYDGTTPEVQVIRERARLIADGKSVCAQCSETVSFRYKETLDLRGKNYD